MSAQRFTDGELERYRNSERTMPFLLDLIADLQSARAEIAEKDDMIAELNGVIHGLEAALYD